MGRPDTQYLDERSLQRHIDDGLLPRMSHPCLYKHGLEATVEGFAADDMEPELYHALMDQGFQRWGRTFFRPRCAACTSCVHLRIPVEDFVATRSQRRVWRRNEDITLEVGEPTLDDAKAELYRRYISERQPGIWRLDTNELLQWIYATNVDTVESRYLTPDGRLIGVGLVDVSRQSLSSMCFFFDPAEGQRSLGVYSVLAEIDLCRQMSVPYYYLGYWVEGARSMAYKSAYFPHEVLVGGRWVRKLRPDISDPR